MSIVYLINFFFQLLAQYIGGSAMCKPLSDTVIAFGLFGMKLFILQPTFWGMQMQEKNIGGCIQ